MLEFACGTGYWTQFIVTTATRVVAVDTSTETMDIARSRVRAHKVEFHTGDAYRLATAHGKFSAAFAGFWLSHVPATRAFDYVVTGTWTEKRLSGRSGGTCHQTPLPMNAKKPIRFR